MTVYSTEKLDEIRKASADLVNAMERSRKLMQRLADLEDEIDASTPEGDAALHETVSQEAQLVVLALGLFGNVKNFPPHIALPVMSQLQKMTRGIIAIEISHDPKCKNKPVDFPQHVDDDLKPIPEEKR